MSFSIEFTAANKTVAKKLIADAYLPDSVRVFLQHAVASLKAADEDHPRAIYVKANGHLHTGSDYDQSTADIVVRPILLAV